MATQRGVSSLPTPTVSLQDDEESSDSAELDTGQPEAAQPLLSVQDLLQISRTLFMDAAARDVPAGASTSNFVLKPLPATVLVAFGPAKRGTVASELTTCGTPCSLTWGGALVV